MFLILTLICGRDRIRSYSRYFQYRAEETGFGHKYFLSENFATPTQRQALVSLVLYTAFVFRILLLSVKRKNPNANRIGTLRFMRRRQDSNITCSVQVVDISMKYLTTFSNPRNAFIKSYAISSAVFTAFKLRRRQDSTTSY